MNEEIIHRLFLRPPDYFKRKPRERKLIDYQLHLNAWDGSGMTAEHLDRFEKHFNVYLKKVTRIDEIRSGDSLVIFGDFGSDEPGCQMRTVDSVKVTEQDGTEVIIDRKMNSFFNLGMYLGGKSWVKKLFLVDDVNRSRALSPYSPNLSRHYVIRRWQNTKTYDIEQKDLIYSTLGTTHHGLQCNHTDERHAQIMEKCAQVVKLIQEIDELNQPITDAKNQTPVGQ